MLRHRRMPICLHGAFDAVMFPLAAMQVYRGKDFGFTTLPEAKPWKTPRALVICRHPIPARIYCAT
jgi:hypothetical protein